MWVEFPDIEPLCKKLGAVATETHADGTPEYTLPVIYDPNTKTVVLDSGAIVRYLDKTYPDTPTLVPAEADALITAFEEAWWGAFSPTTRSYYPIIVPAVYRAMREASKPYFYETRSARFGKLEVFEPAEGSKERAECWAKTEECLTKLAKWWEADGKEKTLVMGSTVSYADMVVASWLLWFKECLGEENAEWKRMLTLDGGRWGRLMAVMDEYSAVDVGEDLQL